MGRSGCDGKSLENIRDPKSHCGAAKDLNLQTSWGRQMDTQEGPSQFTGVRGDGGQYHHGLIPL